MPIRSLDRAVATFGHLFPAIREGVAAGACDAIRCYPAHGHLHRTHTQRSLAYDHITERLASRIGDEPIVNVVRKPQNREFLFSGDDGAGEFLMGARMLRPELAPALNDTVYARDFFDNEPQGDLLDAYGGPTCCYAGYLIRRGQPFDPDVFLVCWHKGKLAWKAELPRGAAGGTATIHSLFRPRDAGDDGDAVVRIRPPEKREDGTDDG